MSNPFLSPFQLFGFNKVGIFVQQKQIKHAHSKENLTNCKQKCSLSSNLSLFLCYLQLYSLGWIRLRTGRLKNHCEKLGG